MSITIQTGSTGPKTVDHSRDKPTGERSVQTALLRGVRHRCPACGKGNIYRRYLKIKDTCGTCGEELHHQRADDAPPYFTMLITGHVIVAGVLALERAYAPPEWVHAAIWGPALLAMSLVLLPRVKGALVALQWALRMHGFGDVEDQADVDPLAEA